LTHLPQTRPPQPITSDKATMPITPLQAPSDRQLVFTSSQAARYVGVSLATIRRWTDAGHIHCYRTPGGQRRFSRDQLEDFVPDPAETVPAASSADITYVRMREEFSYLAIVLDAIAYRKIPGTTASLSTKGLVLSVACGITMGFFYRFVAASMYSDFGQPEPGKLGPYAAVFAFAVGIFLSNFVLNTFIMKKPFVGTPVSFGDYFKGGLGTHFTGILGGIIWGVGMSFSIIAAGKATFAISYGLGQGATMVAAFWGVFIWKEFRTAPPGTTRLIAAMFGCFLVGLALIILARTS